MAFDDPIVWIFILIIVVVVVVFAVAGRGNKTTENIILSLVRSKNGATLDDIIIGAHVSSDKASKFMRKLVSKNVLKVVERDGKTVYVSA